MAITTIQLDKTLVELLKEIREYPKQSYNELIKRMVKVFNNMKKRDQYDKFLHTIQQHKMRELWGSKEDEVWEDA